MVVFVSLKLEKINSWSNGNKLSLNYGKSLFTVFSSKILNCHPQLFIRGQIVPFENKTIFLGVIIGNKLNFSDHVGDVCTELRRSVCIIERKLSGFI